MNNGLGTQIWGDNVFISAFNLDGSPGELIYDTEFRDRGFGVAGGRWDQIDYYQDYNGQRLNASERLLVQFNGAVTDVMLTVGMLGLNEGRRGDDETGQWIAYDADDQEIGRGVFGPDDSDLGPEVKFNRTYGQYPFTVSVNQPIYSLAIEATGFAYGQGEARSGVYKDRGLNSENNSDFNLVSIEYQRTDGVTPMTPEPVTPEPEPVAPVPVAPQPAAPQPATPQPATNRAPIAGRDDQFRIREDIGATAIAYSVLLSNDTDPDGDHLSIRRFNVGDFPGVIENDVDEERILFTTEPNFFGPINLSYIVTDGVLDAAGEILITITPINDAPVAESDGPFEAQADDTISIDIADLLSNDRDPDPQETVTLVSVQDAVNGTVQQAGDQIRFTPAAGFSGQASFTYTINSSNSLDRPVTSNPVVINVAADNSVMPPAMMSLEGSWVITPAGNSRQYLSTAGRRDRDVATLATCVDTPKTWRFSQYANGNYQIVDETSGKALEAWARNPRNGDNASLFKINNESWQQWRITGDADGYQIRGIFNPRLLSVTDNRITVNDAGSTTGQTWTLQSASEVACDADTPVINKPAAPQPATPQPAIPQPATTDESVVLNGQWYFQPIGLPGTTLGVESRDNRTSARALSCDQGAQRWVVNHLGDGLHNITLAGKGRQALEAWQPVPDNLDDVTIYRRNNFSWQRWAFAPLGSDRFIVTGVYNPRALTVDGSANVIVSDADQSAAQQWLVTATDPCSR